MNDTLLPIAGLLMVAFITPGPNNIIVMGAAARGGFNQAVPIMIGIILGTVTLYLLALAGLAQLLGDYRMIGDFLLVAGVAYLAVLGLRMITLQTNSFPIQKVTPDPSPFGIALFQGMNPKSVILITTVAVATSDSIEILPIVLGVIVITAAVCLTIWAMAGSVLSAWLASSVRRRMFDVVMGLLLITSAIILLLYGWGDIR